MNTNIGGNVVTSGLSIAIDSPVTLSGNIVVGTSSSANSSIIFNASIDSSGSTPYSLNVGAGAGHVQLLGPIGSNSELNILTVTGSGGVEFGGDIINAMQVGLTGP